MTGTAFPIIGDDLEASLRRQRRRSKYEKRLRRVVDCATHLLAGPPPPNYTDHGVDHSLGVIERINEMLPSPDEFLMLRSPDKFLYEEEWYCLRCAAYLHDVGMYLDRLGIEPSCSRQEDTPPRDLQERLSLMRDRHASIVWQIMSGRDQGISLDRLGLQASDGCLNSIARIVLGHSGEENFERALAESSSASPQPENRPMREVPLIALFRLADELDLHRTRADALSIDDFSRDESKVHWYRHIYIEGIHAVGGRVSIDYLFEEDMSDNVKEHLREFTEFKLLCEIERTKPYIEQLSAAQIDVRFDRENDINELSPSPARPHFPPELTELLIALAREQHDKYEAIKQRAREA